MGMYASFFGLRELPFNNTPDPRFFFSTPDHEEALACLIYAITEGKGFVLLTGEVGAGKTLITRLMLRHFGERIDFAVINHTQVSASELVQAICGEFRVELTPGASNADNVRRLQDFLLNRFAADRPVVLMLDEAQSLSREAFEQVRMIGNLEADSAKLLQIVIVGQPELRERFEADDMRQLRQRIFRSFHLEGLTREQTEGYIRHRLGVAGAPYLDKIFQPGAIDAIYRYSQGLPRLINTVCDNAMLSAFAADHNSIDQAFVTQVLAQMMTVSQGKPRFATPVVPAMEGAAESAARVSSEGSTDLARREALRRLVGDVQDVHDDCTRALSQFAQNLRREYGRLIEADALRARSELIDSALIERASASGADLRVLVERAETLRGKLEEMIAATRAAAPPQLRDARRVALQLRQLLEEARSAEDDVRKAVASAAAATETTESALASLTQQATRSGQLCVALRNVFDRLETRTGDLRRDAAAGLAQKVVRAATQPAKPASKLVKRAPGEVKAGQAALPSVVHALRDKSQRVGAEINEQRTALASIRELLAATQTANSVPPPPPTPKDCSLRLSREVNDLVDLVHQAGRVA
jgi:type II secretory pathway predicted ATPase ExeA